ncbi:unnamed protein product [Boreogadus saida]
MQESGVWKKQPKCAREGKCLVALRSVIYETSFLSDCVWPPLPLLYTDRGSTYKVEGSTDRDKQEKRERVGKGYLQTCCALKRNSSQQQLNQVNADLQTSPSGLLQGLRCVSLLLALPFQCYS